MGKNDTCTVIDFAEAAGRLLPRRREPRRVIEKETLSEQERNAREFVSIIRKSDSFDMCMANIATIQASPELIRLLRLAFKKALCLCNQGDVASNIQRLRAEAILSEDPRMVQMVDCRAEKLIDELNASGG